MRPSLTRRASVFPKSAIGRFDGYQVLQPYISLHSPLGSTGPWLLGGGLGRLVVAAAAFAGKFKSLRTGTFDLRKWVGGRVQGEFGRVGESWGLDMSQTRR
jgi:hypothetical protein